MEITKHRVTALGVGAILFLLLVLLGASWYAHNGTAPSPVEKKFGIESLTKLSDDSVPLVKPTEIVELSDGDVFDLEATIVKQEVGNRVVKRLAYNGQIPGPILKVEKGASVTVNFTNNIDMETTLHSHGLRGDWRFDGTPGMSQDPIKIGETYTYTLIFPDTGVYWYHPHVREDYQQEMGLYGNFIVEEEEYWAEADQEEYLIFDDMLENGDFSPDLGTHSLMGRYGDTLLINDRSDYNLTVNQGEIVRLFMTDVANTRTFDIHFKGATMKLVGGDNGRIEHEKMVDNVIIAPSERYVVELYYQEPGTYPIGHLDGTIGTITVLESKSNRASDFAMLRSSEGDYEDIRNKIVSYDAQVPDKNISLTIDMKGIMKEMMMDTGLNEDGTVTLMGVQMSQQGAIEHCQMMPGMAGCEPYLEGGAVASHHSSDGIEWEDGMAVMNEMSTDETIEWIIKDDDTGKQNGEIHWDFTQGEMVKVRIYNDEKSMHPMQHPIHFHGQRFVVLSRDGVINDNFQWKDTVLIPRGQTIEILVEMSNPGHWMAHCHIAEHLHAGMMFMFMVK